MTILYYFICTLDVDDQSNYSLSLMMWRFELGLTLLFLKLFKQLLSFLFRCRVPDFIQTGVQLQKLISLKLHYFSESANVLPASQHGSMFLIECNMRTLLLTCETNSVCISIPICESLGLGLRSWNCNQGLAM